MPAQNRDRQGAAVSVCYGTWLPGTTGGVDRDHELFGSPLRIAG